MLSAVFVFFLSIAVAFGLIGRLKQRYPFTDNELLKKLFFYHLFMTVIYYLYAVYNPSDSHLYYEKVVRNFRGNTWWSFYGTSTTFIEFLAYPFIKFLGFSYEAMMLLFSLLGFIGFVYFYIFIREHLRFRHTIFGVDMLTAFVFLPNLHFWSASMGKGAVIFLGMALYFFGISQLKTRYVAIVFGCFIIYHVRPHIMLIVLVANIVGFVFSSKSIGIVPRVLFLAAASAVLFYIYRNVLGMVGIDENEIVSQGLDLTHRATELTKATSGVDITHYSLPMQVVTFLFRPLFFDAPGLLGLIVSFENVFYVAVTLNILNFKGLRYLLTSNFLVKSALLSFLLVSVALAQVSGNLGIAIRQKSQVMLLFMFTVIMFLDEKKRKEHRSRTVAKTRLPAVPAEPKESL